MGDWELVELTSDERCEESRGADGVEGGLLAVDVSKWSLSGSMEGEDGAGEGGDEVARATDVKSCIGCADNMDEEVEEVEG